MLPISLPGVWFDKTISRLLRERSCSSVTQATFVSSGVNCRRGVFAIGSRYRAELSKITRLIAAGQVRPTTVTIGRHKTHGQADTGESATPGAVRCNFGNKHADEWVRWQGGLERRGQRRGMSGDKGSENKRHSEALCTMINHTNHLKSRISGIHSRETAEKGVISMLPPLTDWMPSQSRRPRTGLSGGGSSGKSDEIQFARSFRGVHAHGSVGAKRERGCLSREWEAEEKVRGRVDGGRAVFYRWGRPKGQVIKAATAALGPIGAPQRDAILEGAAGYRSRAGGWGPQNGGRMGAVFGPPLAVV